MALTLTQGEKPGTGVVLIDGAPTGITFTFLEPDLPTMQRLAKLVALGQASEKYTEHFRAYSEATGSLRQVPEADLPASVKDNLAEMVSFLGAVKAR